MRTLNWKLIAIDKVLQAEKEITLSFHTLPNPSKADLHFLDSSLSRMFLQASEIGF